MYFPIQLTWLYKPTLEFPSYIIKKNKTTEDEGVLTKNHGVLLSQDSKNNNRFPLDETEFNLYI